MHPGTGKMTSLQGTTLGPSGGVVEGLSISGGLVALPCASAKRSRLLPEVFDDCSSVCRRLSLRERAIIRDLSEIVFALDLLETGSIVGSESCEKVVLSTFVHRPGITCTSSSPLRDL